MGSDPTSSSLAAARSAYARGDWTEARRLFDACPVEQLEPEDQEARAYAHVIDLQESLAPFERAIRKYESAGRDHDAIRLNLDLARFWASRGKVSVAMGIFRRVTRALEEMPEGAGHAHLAVVQAFFAQNAGQLTESLALAERAHALARKYRDVDAEALALNRRGRLLVRLGRAEEAKADLDESMDLVRSGAMRPIAAAIVYCSMIDACADMRDYVRALEWTEAGLAWSEERRLCDFPGICKIHRAELIRMRGDRAGAHREALAAAELFERAGSRFELGAAHAEIGLGLLEVGELERAEEEFAKAQEMGHEPMPALAVVRLQRGDAPGARLLLETAIEECNEDRLRRARLMPAYVEVCLALGDSDAARTAAEELRSIADDFGTVGLRATASTARARLCLHTEDAAGAVVAARAAVREWGVVDAAYERDRARELLTEAYTLAGDSARASVEGAPSSSPPESEIESAKTMSAPPAGSASPTPDVSPPPLTAAAGVREGCVIDGRIEVGRLLGAGGMGVVYAGKHRITGRDVAIKVLQRGFCGDDAHCARFLQEAYACGRIKSRNVVDVYDAGQHGGEPYIVMELLTGEPLSSRLLRAPQPSVDEAVDVVEQVARGVEAAHAAGVIHRDLKPDNVFLCAAGGETVVKVLDFGISKLADLRRTVPGSAFGTPFYMAPEQVRDANSVDERSDVHAMGVVLFEMLAGRPPYVAASVGEVLQKVANGPRADLRALRSDLPAPVVDVVHRAMALAPEDRPASATDFAAELADVRRALR